MWDKGHETLRQRHTKPASLADKGSRPSLGPVTCSAARKRLQPEGFQSVLQHPPGFSSTNQLGQQLEMWGPPIHAP